MATRSTYIDPAALMPAELEYELAIRGIAIGRKYTNYKQFRDAQQNEAMNGNAPSEIMADVATELAIINNAIENIGQQFEAEESGARMSLSGCDQLMYRLEHYTQRLGRLPLDPSFAGQKAEVTGKLDRVRRKGRLIGSRKLFQSRDAHKAADIWHHGEPTRTNISSLPHKSVESTPEPNIEDLGADTAQCSNAVHMDFSNENQQQASGQRVIQIDPWVLANRTLPTQDERVDQPSWVDHTLGRFYQSIEADVRRQTNEEPNQLSPPAASSSQYLQRPAQPAAEDPITALLTRLVESNIQLQRSQNETRELLQRTLNQRTETGSRRSNLSESAQSYNTSDEREYDRRRTVEINRNRPRQDSSSDRESGDRQRHFNRRRATNPSQWPFVFSGVLTGTSGEPKSTFNKDKSPHGFLAALESARISENLSKSDMVGCMNTLLVGTAQKWWESIVKKRPSYSQFLKFFKDQWFTEEHQFTIEEDLVNYRQKDSSLSLTAFLVEFENRASFLEPPWAEKKLIQTARRNMDNESRRALALMNINTFHELKQLCKKIDGPPANKTKNEKVTKPEESRRSRWSERRVHEVEAKPEVPADASESDENPYEVLYIEKFPKSNKEKTLIAEGKAEPEFRRVVICFNCDAQGHRWRQCSKPLLEFCMRCGKKGVKVPDCPTCSENYWARARGKVESAPKKTSKQ